MQTASYVSTGFSVVTTLTVNRAGIWLIAMVLNLLQNVRACDIAVEELRTQMLIGPYEMSAKALVEDKSDAIVLAVQV